MTEKIPDYVLIKPVGSRCNAACSYCFYYHRGPARDENNQVMDREILEELIRQCLSGPNERFSFGWQGGEPTLAGLDFFQAVIGYQKKYGRGKRIGNALQTNGLLLDRRWIEFLSHYRFLIGLSLDGPELLHNAYRIFPNGTGTWRRAEHALKALLGAGAAVNTMTVVNDVTVSHPEELYSFFQDAGIRYMQFMPCVETDPLHPDRAAPFSVDPEDYGSFLCTLFDLWKADVADGNAACSIRFFDTVAAAYAGLPVPECTHRIECGDYVVVEMNGDVYSCDFFVEDAWLLGNIMETSIRDLLNSRHQRTFAAGKAALPTECSDCRWLSLCRGGCVKDRLRDPSDHGRNHFCHSYKRFFAYSEDFFKALTEMSFSR